ncbi:hypothetical protein [Kineococcus sp. GCM10028916]|uniref:hypothetical protein n=1 Tax=Kineococcus sp. GCM10028916 TaxID=3273394 RepID=UPI0036D3C0CF
MFVDSTSPFDDPCSKVVSNPGLDRSADLSFAAGPDIRRLISGELAAEQTIASGVVEVLSGPRILLGRFVSTFHLTA